MQLSISGFLKLVLTASLLVLGGLHAGIVLAGQPQTIGTVSFSPNSLAVGGITTVSATATSGLAVSFSSLTPSICTVSNSFCCPICTCPVSDSSICACPLIACPILVGSDIACPVNASWTVTGISEGTCTVAANQAGNATYSAAPQVKQSIQVTSQSMTSQTISAITFSPSRLTVGGATTVSATATSGLPVSFSSTTPSICTVSDSFCCPVCMCPISAFSTVTGITAGICTIAANQAGDAVYSAAPQVTQSITITTISQSDCLFNWAEKIFPQYFSPAGAKSLTLPPYYFRYYSNTGDYLAVSSADNNIYVLGTSFNDELVDVGPETFFLDASGCH